MLLSLTTEGWIVFGVVIVGLFLFITEWLSIDLVAMVIMLGLVLTGVLPADKALAGFSNNATITVAFMFVLSHALLKTGVLNSLAPKLSKFYRKGEVVGLLITMLVVAAASAFINNTPVIAVLIPVMIQVSKLTGIPASRLLIPISFATIFGGTCTLIGTSTNIVVSGMAEKAGIEGLGMFTLTPAGLIFMVIGTLFMVFIGRKLLPNRAIDDESSTAFRVADYVIQFKLANNSPLAGQRIMDAELLRGTETDVIEVVRGTERFTVPQGDLTLHAGDQIKVRCNMERVKRLREQGHLELSGENTSPDKGSTKMVEVVVKYGSAFEGKTLRELDLRRRFRAIPLALRHREELLQEHLHDTPLRTGDVILMETKSHYVSELRKQEVASGDFIIITEEEVENTFDRGMATKVSLTLLAVVLTAAFEVVPIVIGTVAGVIFLVLAKVLNMKEVYTSIQWKIVFLLAGALSLGEAMRSTGLADALAGGLIEHLGDYGPIVLLSGFYFATSLLTEVMSNNATAALMTPVALSAAIGMGVSPMPFMISIALAASASFSTPIGYQTNSMVYSAGNYKFTDFLRVGVPLNILMWIVATVVVPLLYPCK